MMQSTSPIEVAVYTVGVVIAIPSLLVLVRVIYFVAEARTKLDTCVTGQEDLKRAFSSFKHEIRTVADEHDKRIMLVERDVEQLKESAA